MKRGVNTMYLGVIAQIPQRLGIESSKYCQLRCVKCPTGLQMDMGEKGYLSFDHFKALLCELSGFNGTITFSNWGEPFLNKELFKILLLATQNGIRTTASSNLCHKDPDFAKNIVASGIHKITVGIDGATEETYLKYRRNGDWATVMANIENINAEKKKLGTDKPELVWQIILTKYNEHEVEMAKELAEERGMAFKIKPLRQSNVKEVSSEDWQPSATAMRKYFSSFEKKHQRKQGILRCQDLWMRPSIDWNGDVYPCCIVKEKKYSMGNAFQNGFLSIWNSIKYQESRKLILDQNYHTDLELACENCPNRCGIKEW